ncbi:hypothetical protein [Saccharothrix stipae]
MTSEENPHVARLIPTSGLDGADERRRRATSALLAVMSAVHELGRALTRPLGAPAADVRGFVEVPFDLGGREVVADGVIRVVRGQRSWTALVEVRTGADEVPAGQLEDLLDLARARGFDAVLTISNEVPPLPGHHPTAVDRRPAEVVLHHWSWTEVLCEAVAQKERLGVAEADRAWLLGELIRYLEHPRSGTMAFEDMGPGWVALRESVQAGTVRATDPTAVGAALRFDALVRFASLELGRRLGAEVTPALTRRELAEPQARVARQVDRLVAEGRLTAGIHVAGTVGALQVTADLRTGRVSCHVDLDGPREGRPTTRVEWLVRQLKDAPDTVRLEAFAAHGPGAGASQPLGTLRADPTALVAHPAQEIRGFRVADSGPLGSGPGTGPDSFIASVSGAVTRFYEDVVRNLKPWAAAPPRIRSGEAFADGPGISSRMEATSGLPRSPG